ncbi:MAG: DUF2974 domain-containing protein [Lachnospiraceae bacterium]|nr:DUF2974 domain-containing protein [Lachnospiraceae bacterium]
MALTTEQLLLLNNLMYMKPNNGDGLVAVEDFEGQSVAEWLNSIDTSQIQDQSLVDASEWQAVIEAARNDPTIMSMTIATTNTDWSEGGGGGRSAVFINEATGDAVVTFCGTASQEWKDDFYGGNMTDTPQQINALNWYNQVYEELGLDGYEVTVTGHSKGGNKSKYITLLTGTVDHCVSFDGQGFSDDFYRKYADEIAARQGLIENHNLENDFVNFLLNDVGETHFYQGFGVSNFAENHCANSFMNYDPATGTWSMVEVEGRTEVIEGFDRLVNGYLRSLPPEKRDAALEVLGTLVQGAMGTGDLTADQIIQLVLYDGNEDMAYLLAYILEFGDEYGFDYLHGILDDFGLGGLCDVLESFTEIMDAEFSLFGFTFTMEDIWELIQTGGGILGGILAFIGIDDLLAWVLNQFDLPFTVHPDDFGRLFELISSTIDYTYEIDVTANDTDLTIDSARTGHGFLWMNDWLNFHIIVDAAAIHAAEDALGAAASQMEQLIEDTQNVINSLSNYMPVSFFLKQSLYFTKLQMQSEVTKLNKMSDCLEFVLKNFQVSEEKIIVYMGEVVH